MFTCLLELLLSPFDKKILIDSCPISTGTYLLFKHFFTGFDEIVRNLIRKGANVNALTEESSSALILAAMNGSKFQNIFPHNAYQVLTKYNGTNDVNSLTQGERVLQSYSLKMALTKILSTN